MPGPANRIPARVWEERVFCEKCGTQVTRYERVEETMCAEELMEWYEREYRPLYSTEDQHG